MSFVLPSGENIVAQTLNYSRLRLRIVYGAAKLQTKGRCSMRHFYERVHVDPDTLRFYAACPICGRKYYAARVPLLCRGVRTFAKCAKGKANRISQSLFNHAKANSVHQLPLRHFNQCRGCLRLVCDDCYDISHSDGACRECSQKESE